MPNHISNRLKVIADSSKVKEVLAAISGEKDGTTISIDFNKIVPMPNTLNITSSTLGYLGLHVFHSISDGFTSYEDAKEKYDSLSEPHQKEAKDLGQKYADNLKKYGHQSWYSWRIEYWGTKWNAYGFKTYDTEDTIHFETAWSAPIKLIEKLSIKFPDVVFQFDYASEDCSYNTGKLTIQNGSILNKINPEGGSKEAYELYFELHPDSKDDFVLVDGNYVCKDE